MARVDHTMVDQRWTALPVPFAIEVPDRIPKERYYDPDFFRLEAEQLWPRVWQMACRLEEIPKANDFVEYEILDQSIVVVRTEDGVVAFQNACRHRGVRVVQGRGTCEGGFTCPFHGWCYAADGTNTAVTSRRSFSEHNLRPDDLDLVPVRCETWGGCAWINLDDDAPPLRQCLEPVATILDAWQVESMRAEWWYAARLPVNWKLAQEAFQEQYHVLETHPELRIPGALPGARRILRSEAVRRVGAAVPPHDERRHGGDGARQRRAHRRGAARHRAPRRPRARPGRSGTERLNDAVVRWHREAGHTVPDLNQLEADGRNEPMGYGFPHFFVLPMYSSASQYRFRPLGPEETLMEIWSLTRFAEGEEPPPPPPPEPWESDDPRWPPIPTQDFSNLPRQQKGLHAKGFEYMRISEQMEGHISNLHRTIDGFLAGLPYERLLPALQEVNVNPLERAIVDFAL